MNRAEPNITVNVDVTNPGQFFACCGLLELADRLWPGAEGWFEDTRFCVACDGNLGTLLEAVSSARIESSVTDEGLKRLGTLLSAKKSTLSEADQEEKDRLRSAWQEERLYLDSPFNLALDWWRDGRNERTAMKTWAAKQFILYIVRPLQLGIRLIIKSPPFEDVLFRVVTVDGLPLYFDSHAQCQSTALDAGFSLYDLRNTIKEAETTRPALDFLAFVGLQRVQPKALSARSLFQFFAWETPLPVSIVAAAAVGLVPCPGAKLCQFPLLDRTKYMKAFLPATPMGDAR